ncbi:hypothetical protein CJD36_000290 [Flavipsychrobacter stenotrophus]|uniref:Copper-binding protein MbnP-like domain-containing protein n=1 Tax=Flavipsychrobacter stenotrophus TaxID=2077091 RepID=A0A2S7SZU8_9BACT|nr:MbnP family protein [Flavipsychrobacter stenotrophus]PQJ12234.1 hypothetical protein CJD36_000290 [Flavipsychrobacter stenotrophus]
MKTNIITLVLLATAAFTSCRYKDKNIILPVAPVSDSANVKIEVFNMVGTSSLNMGNQWYRNEHNDSFQVTTFNYYISNIKLNSASATYTEDYSYHLVQQSLSSSHIFDLANVPYGTYTGITFTIGVDSAHNVTGTQSGPLDPINGMFWSWTTGYVMLKFEGVSPRSPQANNAIAMHAGGFSGVNNVLKTVTLTFPTPITVGSGAENHVHLAANVLALFKSPNIIDFSTLNTIHMPGPDAKLFADNYASMFSVSYAGL